MNNPVQASRAGSSLPTGQSIKPAIGKDTRAGALFANFLASEIKRDRERKTEDPEPSDEIREPDEKPGESARSRSSVRDPMENLMAVVYQAPPKPAEPPCADSFSGGTDAAEKIGETGAACSPRASAQSAPQTGLETPDAGKPQPAAATSDSAEAQKAQTTADGDAAAAQVEPFQSALKSEAAAAATQAVAAFKTTPDVATSAGRPDLMDLQVPAAAQQAAQARENDQSASAHANSRQAQDQSAGTANQAAAATPAQQAQNAAVKATPEQAKAAADAAAALKGQVQTTDLGGTREMQAALGGTQNLSTNPLQSLESARLAETQNKGMIWQVCQNVETMLKNRQTSMRLTLFPEDLGRIDLRLTTSSSGMGISMIAQHAGTGQMLESQLAQLRQALDQAGIQLAHLSVGQQRSQAGSGQTGQQSRGQSSTQPQSQTIQPLVEERMGRNSLEATEGYDYLV